MSQPSLFPDFVTSEPIQAIRNGHNDSMTVAEVISFFLSHGPSVDPRFHKDRSRILRMFVEAHGHLPLQEAKPFHLRLWVDGRTEWKSDWRKKAVISAVQTAFNFCTKLGYIQRNPFAGVSHPQGNRGRPMTSQEFRTLLRNSDACYRRILFFLTRSIARPYEGRELEKSELNTTQGCIIKRKHKTSKTRKDHAPRVIPLDDVLVRLMIWICRRWPNERFVFLNSRGKPWTRSALDLRLWRMRKKLGIPEDCKLYSARHAGATDFLRRGGDLVTLAAILGHTSTRMSEYYAHLAGNVGHLREAMNRTNNGQFKK